MSDSTSSGEQIRAVWFAAEGGDASELRKRAEQLRAAESGAQVEILEPTGMLPVVGFIVLAIGLAALAREIFDLLCKSKKPGMIIDATGSEVKIQETRNLPGGTVIVVGKDGNSTSHNVCEGKVSLTDLIKSAVTSSTGS